MLAIALGARITKMKTSTARGMFYIYAALMGFSLSVIFAVYDLGTIGIALALCAGFFFALTMLGMTTKVDLLKAGPILGVGLIVLIIAEVLLMIFAPGQTTLMLVSAIGLTILPELLRAFADYRKLANSEVQEHVMIFRPQGIFGSWEFSLPRLVNRMLFRGAAGKGAKPAASAKQHDQSDDKTVKEASR